MFYADVQHLKPADFKRLTGVIPATFVEMCDALQKQLPGFGRPPKLCREDRLLMTLMYWREYRTQFHIATTYGLSEAAVSRTIRAVEDALTRSGRFTLPGKKALTQKHLQKHLQSQWQKHLQSQWQFQAETLAEPVAVPGGRRGRHRVSGGASPKKQRRHYKSKGDTTKAKATLQKQRRHYSGKKKRHTQKAQVLIEQVSGRITARRRTTGNRLLCRQDA